MAFPYSLYKGLSQPVPNTPVDRRDLLDVNGTNTIQSARYIDPITKDFVVSSTNHFVGQNAVDAGVLLSVNTTLNTTLVANFGQSFKTSIQMIRDLTSLKTSVFNVLQECLSYQVSNNQITFTVDQVSVNVAYGQINISFSYTNNTTNTMQSVSFLT